MPIASRTLCLRPRGFSQIASCKAQGFIPRTSRKYRGKYIISPKYRKLKRSLRRSIRRTLRRSRR